MRLFDGLLTVVKAGAGGFFELERSRDVDPQFGPRPGS